MMKEEEEEEGGRRRGAVSEEVTYQIISEAGTEGTGEEEAFKSVSYSQSSKIWFEIWYGFCYAQQKPYNCYVMP